MNKPRKLALAVLASITIAGIAGASASSLGGLNSASLGSDDTITASCQTTLGGIDVSYGTSYNTSTGKNDVGSVTFSGVDTACNTLSATLTLSDIAFTPLSSRTQPVALSGGAFTVTLTTPVDAQLVENLALVIQG